MLRFFILALFLISFSDFSMAQQHDCGTTLEDANLPFIRSLNRTITENQNIQRSTNSAMSFVPVQLHIIRKTDGTDGISSADYLAAFDHLNEIYKEAGIHFYECSPINYVDNDTYFDLNLSDLPTLHASESVDSVINIYSMESLISGGSNLCGKAYFPGSIDVVLLDNDCTIGGSTFAHEIGHYFNLYHTHEVTFGAEAVDGSDCTSQGDLVCDTPADPGLTSVVDILCVYNGSDVDENMQAYLPATDNIMSYSRWECRTFFTPDQIARMQATLATARNYLHCDNTLTLDADFYYDYDNACNNSLSVEFCDASDGQAISWFWDFGDGDTSSLAAPSHTYNTPGIYTVNLSTTNTSGTNVDTQSNIIRFKTQSIPYAKDFENGGSALFDFTETSSLKNFVSVDPAGAKDGTYGLVMDGFPVNQNPYFNAFGVSWAFHQDANKFYKSRIETCIDATGSNFLTLTFDMKQLFAFNAKYTNFRVLVNETQVGGTYQADGSETWDSISINLNDYSNTVFTLAFEGSHKYDKDYQTTNGTATFIDNIKLTNTSDAFVTTWKTDNSGTSNDDQITIPGIGSYDIYWEETGNSSNNGTSSATGNHTITFPNAGTYQVEISGGLHQIKFDNSGDKLKLLSIKNWGDIAWTSMNSAFEGCTKLTSTATDVPDLSSVTDCYEMFRLCSKFNGAIGLWDVSNVTDMGFLFAFATNFNQDLNTWNVSQVTSMKSMFRSATAFNQNLSNWNLVNVTDTRSMFRNANSFNQDIGDWNVSQVTNMKLMFGNAKAFNQNLGNWDITQVNNLDDMLDSTAMSVINYDSTLINWATQNVIHNLQLGADNLEFCTGKAARNTLRNAKNWTINGDTKSCSKLFLSTKIFLEGALLNDSDIANTMNDDLRLSGFIPTISPYTDAITCDQSVLNVNGEKAIVDWIWLELRDANDYTTIVKSRSALLLRDGNIVDVDGASEVIMEQDTGSYFIVISHRNHLSIMSATPQYFGYTNTSFDFINSLSSIYGGANSVADLVEGYALICGDVNNNNLLQNTDIFTLLSNLGNSGYSNADLDMNGQIQNAELDFLLIPNLGKGKQF